MAGNYPRIPGITLGLGLVHDPLWPVTHRFALLVQSGELAPSPRLPVVKRRTTCPSSDGSTRDEDGLCLKDRRGYRSPWTTLAEGPTTRELSLPRINDAARLTLTAPRSWLSLTRFVFRHLFVESSLLGETERSVGFPPCGRPRAGHSGDQRFGCGWESHPTVVPSAS